MRGGGHEEGEQKDGEDTENRAGAQGLTPSVRRWRIPPNPDRPLFDRKVSYLFESKVTSDRDLGNPPDVPPRATTPA
ncbi:hypothetical protein GCM10009735_48370 [Actinomadura chokoriensis]